MASSLAVLSVLAILWSLLFVWLLVVVVEVEVMVVVVHLEEGEDPLSKYEDSEPSIL